MKNYLLDILFRNKLLEKFISDYNCSNFKDNVNESYLEEFLFKEGLIIRIADNGIEKCSVVNGPGIRYTIFIQGCTHNCKGCHNPQTHNFNEGKIMSIEDVYHDIFLSRNIIKGITFSGGDPLNPQSINGVTKLCSMVKSLLPDKDIWLYTGFKWELICSKEIINYIDVIVDGEFIEKLKSYNLKFKGSSNQRIIDVNSSREEGKLIEWYR